MREPVSRVYTLAVECIYKSDAIRVMVSVKINIGHRTYGDWAIRCVKDRIPFMEINTLYSLLALSNIFITKPVR